MKKVSFKKTISVFFLVAMAGVFLLSYSGGSFAQEAPSGKPRAQKAPPAQPLQEEPINALIPRSAAPKPIVIEEITDTIEERFTRMITLDVREMNVIDVLKFLALKGDFNMITSDQVAGRVTLFLKNVSIGDALEIILIANRLAYHVERDVIHIISEAEYQSMYGKKYNDKNEVDIFQLKYAKPEYVLKALENVKSNLGRIIIDEDTGSVVLIDTPESIKEMKDVIVDLETSLDAVVYTLQFAKVEDVAEKLKARIDAHSVGTITVDERTNKVIVRALPERRKEVEALIKSLDTPTKEVLVEARILQITFKPEQEFGIDWHLDFRNSDHKMINRMDFQNVMLQGANLGSNFGKVGVGDFDVNQFQATIKALKTVSNTKVLSNPKILVTNNEEAQIHVGDTVPYIVSTTSGTGDNAITSEDIRFVDVGLKLSVTPNISDDGFVTMALKPEISTVTATITATKGTIPQVNKTFVETTVMVKDGMTVILGGLKKDNKVLTRRGVPVLMDIPLLNRVFGYTKESVEATEIIIFITPHIITGDEDYGVFDGNIKTTKDLIEKKDENVPSTFVDLELKS